MRFSVAVFEGKLRSRQICVCAWHSSEDDSLIRGFRDFHLSVVGRLQDWSLSCETLILGTRPRSTDSGWVWRKEPLVFPFAVNVMSDLIYLPPINIRTTCHERHYPSVCAAPVTNSATVLCVLHPSFPDLFHWCPV